MATQVMMEAEKHTAEGSIRYPGWGVGLAAFVGVMVSFAAIMPYTFSLFLEPLSKAFGSTQHRGTAPNCGIDDSSKLESASQVTLLSNSAFAPGRRRL
jgi:hypothetical protein